MQHHQDITQDNSCGQEVKDSSQGQGDPTQVARNDNPLSMCHKQPKAEPDLVKNNIDMSPTSSHCVENDRTNITYELDQLNLTQPSRNLYKAKNSNLRSIDETSLCLPFKAMTSPSTRQARNNSLLAHFNEYTDQFKDTSPPDIIPYQGGKYAQNAKSLQQKLMQCNQNADNHGVKKEDGREASDCCSPPQHQMLLYQNHCRHPQLGDGLVANGNHPRKGDGSNCSSVSRFINSQQSGYMDQKLIGAKRHCERASVFPRQGNLSSQGIKVYKTKGRLPQQQFLAKEPPSAQFDEIILEFDREYEKDDQVTPRKKEDEKGSFNGREESKQLSNVIKKVDSSDVIATCDQKPNRQLTAKKNAFKVDQYPTSLQDQEPHQNSQKCLRLKIMQSAQQEKQLHQDQEDDTHFELSQMESADQAENVGKAISKTVLKSKKAGGRPIYLKIKIDGNDVQIKQDNSDQEEMSHEDPSHISAPEDCPLHSQSMSTHDRSRGGHGYLGKRPMSNFYHHTPSRISAQKSLYHQSFDDMTYPTSQKNKFSTPCQNHCSNWKDQGRMDHGCPYGDDTMCSGLADEASKEQNYTNRIKEVDLSDLVLKSEYDQEQQAEAISVASFTEKTTMIQADDKSKNQCVSMNVQNRKIVKKVFTPRTKQRQHDASQEHMQKIHHRAPHADDPHASCSCCLTHGGSFLENLFRKHYMEMQEFRAFAKHMMYMDYHNQHHHHHHHRPHHQSQSHTASETDEGVQSWHNYQGNIFKRQKKSSSDQQKNLGRLKALSLQGSEVKTPAFNKDGECPLALDRKFQPQVVPAQPKNGPSKKPPTAIEKNMNVDQQQVSVTSIKNTTENADPKEAEEDKETGNEKENRLVPWEGSKGLQLPPVPQRAAFGEITNSRMPQPSHFLNESRMQTEMTDLFFGVTKPFFSKTYKKREKKVIKKVEKAKTDLDVKEDKKTDENDDKKDKSKPRTQKNSEQKQALQIEFQKDPTWSNAQCKRISQQTGLSVAQVYKWGWDKKNRISAPKQGHGAENMPGIMPLVLGDSSEFMIGPPHQQDFDRMQGFGMRGMGF